MADTSLAACAGRVQADPVSHRTSRVGRSVFATFMAALGPLSFGYCLAYSSSALEDLKNLNSNSPLRLTTYQGSWFSSLVTVGAIFGSPIGGWAIDKLGRRSTIVMCVIPFDLGWLLITYAQNCTMLYAGRLITGLACGIISLTVPVYIAEIVSARLRGMLGSVNQLAVTLGLVLGYVMGVFLSWNWLAFMGTVPPTLLAIFMYWMPETPRWSLGNNRRRDALQALFWLRGPDADVDEECSEIEATLDTHEKLRWREIITPAIAKPLVLSVGLMFFQQFCGINAVLFNAADIFAAAGFNKAKLVTISIGLVQFFGTGLACLVMDKAGRRILLWTTALGMCLSLVALGVYFQIMYIPGKTSGDTVKLFGSISHSVPADNISWLSILSLILFNLVFALAWGPVPWLAMSELFPLRARGPASSVSTLCNWSLAFVVTKTYEDLEHAMTAAGVYWFYAGWSFLAFLFVFFFLPETKGKTLEQIEAMFDKQHPYKPIE